MSYEPGAIEAKWQQKWKDARVAEVDLTAAGEKFYMLNMFPYPSGDLHVGHGRNYILGDALFRYLKMQGKVVFNPMGWDAFGLPAENAAIQRGIHPGDWTRSNIAREKEQFERWGILYDWSKELASCDADYYKWNQWLFLQMYKRGLAYRGKAPVNWCGGCRTVLANEQVVDGRCERCGTEVEQKNLEQWFFRITEYAERLDKGLDGLTEWPEKVKLMQRNWIGRSTGADVEFEVPALGRSITVYTTRPDTLYGATFLVLAPEHPAVEELLPGYPQRDEMVEWIRKVRNQSQLERQSEGDKEGRFTGRFAINPFTGEEIPIWLGNFVLPQYGTGAIMSVPAHDQRDFEFAKRYGLPIRVVVQPAGFELNAETMTEAYEEKASGHSVSSGSISGLTTQEAIESMIGEIESLKRGKGSTRYRLRDWLISRQRYWGTPIPMVYCDKCGLVPVPEADLPVRLPLDVPFTGREGNPLAKTESFVDVECPRCQDRARRETDTMDTFVDSSWYYCRFTSPHDPSRIFAPEFVNRWLPVDQYIGGIEHAILHLLYARFITRVLFDMGLVGFEEPFRKLFNQGLITKEGYRDPSQNMGWVPLDQVEMKEGVPVRKGSGASLLAEVGKMSKSRYNVVPPDELIERYGADTERVYTLFIAPPEQEAAWSDEAVIGPHRFLNRVWNLGEQILALAGQEPDPGSVKMIRKAHQTIAGVSRRFERFELNTAISLLMELSHSIGDYLAEGGRSRSDAEAAYFPLLKLLHPFAPHITEEIWERFGKSEMMVTTPWPVSDESLMREESMTVVVQVNGKLRANLDVPNPSSEETVVELARTHPKVAPHIVGKMMVKTIYVPGKLVNLVVK